MNTIFILLVGVAAIYGAFLAYKWLRDNFGRVGTTVAALGLGVLAMVPGASTFAQEETSIVVFNLDPFFDSLNQYLPIFIGLFAIIGGIAGAMALARYVIGAVVRAFSGSGNI